MFLFLLIGFSSYDVVDPSDKCVIDRCENNFCVVETPEGTVEIKKKPSYQEGKKIECPTWLVEPT